MIPAGRRVQRLGGLSLLWRPRSLVAGLCLIGCLIALAVALLGTGRLALGPVEVWQALLGRGDPTAARILQGVRLPRLLTAAGVGAALGMAGAVFQSLSRNPLGSRALYLYEGGRDTYLRIHGSPEARSIGGRASSGCVRMVMAHIIDLYDLVETGSTAFLYPPEDALGAA